MAPVAPPMFSTMTGPPSALPNGSLKARAVKSLAAPAG
jgi:hypothetical protein